MGASEDPRTASDEARDASDEVRRLSDEELRDVASSLRATASDLARAVKDLVPAMNTLSRSNVTLAQKNHQKAIVIVVLVVLVAAAGLFGWRLQAQSTCSTNWANRSTNRTSVLVPLSNTRNTKLRLSVEAEHTALHFALTHPGGAPADVATLITYLGSWDTATSAFLTADSNYAMAVANNPVPDSPKFDCPAF